MSKVCHVIYEHPPFDPRVFYKEAVSLQKAGFDVVMLVPSRDGKSLGRHKDVEITHQPFYKEGILFEYYDYNKKWPKNFGIRNAKTKQSIIRKMKAIDADVYHFHEHDISMEAAVEFKQLYPEKKMVFDFHEFFFARYREKPEKGKEFLKYVQLEREVLRLFELIVTVDKPLSEFYKRLGASRVCTVMNAQSAFLFNDTKKIENKYNQDTLYVCHEGRMLFDRGLKNIIEIARKLKSDNVKFLIIGRLFDKENAYFQQKLDEYGLHSRFEVTGWQLYHNIGKFLNASHIGLFFMLSKNGQFGLANKFFNYLRFGLPIISVEHATSVDIIDEYKCGIVLNAEDTSAIAHEIDRLNKDRAVLEEMSKNSETAFNERYNWEHEAQTLVDYYRLVLKE